MDYMILAADLARYALAQRLHPATCHGWYGNYPPKMDESLCDCRDIAKGKLRIVVPIGEGE